MLAMVTAHSSVIDIVQSDILTYQYSFQFKYVFIM